METSGPEGDNLACALKTFSSMASSSRVYVNPLYVRFPMK
jgi:hypothetical protein